MAIQALTFSCSILVRIVLACGYESTMVGSVQESFFGAASVSNRLDPPCAASLQSIGEWNNGIQTR